MSRNRQACDAAIIAAFASIVGGVELAAQQPTLLPERTVVGIANTVSGSRALDNLIDFTGYNRDRSAEEFAGTYLESELFARKAREYGFSDVEILRYPRNGTMWDGIRGELWVTSPVERKIVDFKDIPTALAPGSVTGTYEGELVWIPDASDAAAYEGVDVQGKIVFTESSTGGAFRQATQHGAIGVVNVNVPRPHVTPEAIQWSSIGNPDGGFAFNISSFMQDDLQRLVRTAGPLRVRAIVEAAQRQVDEEVITAVIPGDGSTDEWVYYSAHVFEGANKQGAADDGSGAVLILEAGRTILEAMERGYVSRPARNIRFLWVDEFRGTYAFLNDHPEELAKTVADINIDMAGQNVTLNNNATRLYRMPDSRIHYVADVTQEFFEWVGMNNMERVHERRGGYGFSFPIVDPYGTRDAWRYVIEPFYGSSDHQVYNDRGVPAVLFNHWPDMVYHSSHDRPNLMDATQMKRSAFIAAASGLVVAGAPEADPQQVAAEAHARGTARVAAQLGEWSTRLAAMPADELARGYKELESALHQWFLREAQNVRSTIELTRGSTAFNARADSSAISDLVARVAAEEETARASVWTYYEGLAAARGVRPVRPSLTAEEHAAQQLIPTATGQSARVAAPGLPGFSSMEIRNFTDGRRSALDIRNAVNAEYATEYGTITLDAVVGYLRALADAGVVRISGD